MPDTIKYRSVLNSIKKQVIEKNGYSIDTFECKICLRKWEPSWDRDGNFYKESYKCPNGCNREFFEEVKK